VHLARYGDISPPANGAFNLLEQKGYVVAASACVVQQLCTCNRVSASTERSSAM